MVALPGLALALLSLQACQSIEAPCIYTFADYRVVLSPCQLPRGKLRSAGCGDPRSEVSDTITSSVREFTDEQLSISAFDMTFEFDVFQLGMSDSKPSHKYP